MSGEELVPCKRCGAKPRRNRVWHDKSCRERHAVVLERGDLPRKDERGDA